MSSPHDGTELPPKWTHPLTEVPTFRFNGDHVGIENWAAHLVAERTGKEPDMAVFEGDCHGIYINPQRLAEIGLPSGLLATVHIAHGESVKFEGGEFLPVNDQWVKRADPAGQPAGVRTYTTTSPILVKAVQLTEDADWEAIATWCGGELVSLGIRPDGKHIYGIAVPQSGDGDGAVLARWNDWVVQGVTGSFVVRSPEEFAATYTPAEVAGPDPFAEQRASELQERYDDLEARFIDLIGPLAKLLGVPAVVPDPDQAEGVEAPENPPQVWNLDGIHEALLRIVQPGLLEHCPDCGRPGPHNALNRPGWVECHACSASWEATTADAAITPHEASVVLHHFGGPGGYPPGGFVHLLLAAMGTADVTNLARFRAGFPGLTAAVDLAKFHRGGIERLQAIAAGQQVTR